jgi:predicted ATP-dependent serine protease
VLRGRDSERATLGQPMNSVRAGERAALVLRGESGIGKTALLEDVIASGGGCRVVHAAGVESEMELGPRADRADRGRQPRRQA